MQLKLPKSIIKAFGDIYIHKLPMFIVYKPEIHKVKGNEVRQVINYIKPGDILFSRHDGYLSTMATPGLWGHSALFEGENSVIESIGSGVRRIDILDFCRVDSVAICRINNIVQEQINNAIEIARKMVVDKISYDFEYSDNNGTVYCTELISLCYPKIFDNDFVMKYGHRVLVPDGLYESKKVTKILAFIH